jgi:hypothetical protein
LNNSRQIGLAIHQYHDSKKELPPSRIRDRFLTWAALILPFAEETSVGNLVDPDNTFAEQSETFRTTPIALFRCPSRSQTEPFVERNGYAGIKGDYSAVTSTFLLEGPLGRLFDGGMILGDVVEVDHHTLESWKSRTALKDVIDGLSRTFLVAEASLWAVDRASIYDGDDNPGAILGDKVYPAEIEALVNKHPLHPIAESESQPGAWVGSAHWTIIHVTMADNSSRAINKDVDIKLVEQLVTRAAGDSASLADISAD